MKFQMTFMLSAPFLRLSSSHLSSPFLPHTPFLFLIPYFTYFTFCFEPLSLCSWRTCSEVIINISWGERKSKMRPHPVSFINGSSNQLNMSINLISIGTLELMKHWLTATFYFVYDLKHEKVCLLKIFAGWHKNRNFILKHLTVTIVWLKDKREIVGELDMMKRVPN